MPSQQTIGHLEAFIKILSDAHERDDLKYKALKDISENFEELTSSHAYTPLLDNLLRAFLKLLQETSPQFIAENNTLQLRKLMLELLLRMSTNETVKHYSKNIQLLLLSIVAMENEDQALIILKILTDHIKAFRPPFPAELTSFLMQWKNAYREMFRYASEEKMFENRRLITANPSMEDGVMEALQSCFFTTTLTFTNSQSQGEYTIIPKATQSVKVLAEMSVFLLFLVQPYRLHLTSEIAELVPLFVRYINISVPKSLRQNQNYNKELVDEFHNSQVRALTFIAYTTRQAQFTDLMNENASAISNGIKLLFDNLHSDVINQRRDLLVAIKYFFQCGEMRANFIPIIPRMTIDSILLGTSFTSIDQLRFHAYTLLADILHHVRTNLPYKILTHIFFISARNLHDPSLSPYVQTMYGKLMMNFVEPLLKHEKVGDEPG
uniref:Uncharacterized protein n=1 Tax=Ditylenchus dipsaci TaxID=166011 RepID=A0A915D5E6_9BILA